MKGLVIHCGYCGVLLRSINDLGGLLLGGVPLCGSLLILHLQIYGFINKFVHQQTSTPYLRILCGP